MLLPRVIPLLIHAPTPPDFYQCNETYGRNIKPLDCQLAVEWDWPTGNTPVHYYFEDPVPSNAIRIPRTTSQGTCKVTIEPAGPSYGKAYKYASYLKHEPDKMRALAGYVIDMCAHKGQGIGGFVTVGMKAAENYVRGALNEPWEDAQDRDEQVSTNGAFLTISINGAGRTSFRPGDTDPSVPAYLSTYAMRLAQLFGEKATQYRMVAFMYHWFANRMQRGGDLVWTGPPSPGYLQQQMSNHSLMAAEPEVDPDIQGSLMPYLDKMVYQCDASLGGAPDPTDCEKLSWSGLQTPDAVETLEAGVPKFYQEGEQSPAPFFGETL